ncbi:MAG: glycine--tRNA ligase [Acidobacteria bacterium]|nr:glycine--tRNA ligase [Acidobacteriota bacterium]
MANDQQVADDQELDSLDALVSLCKRRGYIFQSSEIYGGLNGFWDYGPLGVELKNNVFDFWWDAVVRQREDVVGYDASIIMHPKVWEASGHLGNFYDMMVDCTECKRRYRTDHLMRDLGISELPKECPNCGGELSEPREFGLMFETFVGATKDSQSVAYLRPETAQAIFVNFRNVQMSTRMKVPFGIAQRGKAFRNEVTPRNFTFRSREFEQMEMEFFVHESEERQWFDYWREARMQWYLGLGIREERLRFREHDADELAHYARYTTDVEYQFPFGWQELEGICNRGSFDLSMHNKHSGKDQAYFDEARQEKYVPSVVEISAGLDRTVLTVLVDAFAVEQINGEERTVLRLAPHIAPRQVAVFPLSKKLGEQARKLADELQRRFNVLYDEQGSIGKRYRREDEVGTPFCVTFDFNSLDDGRATVRDRDTMEQERVALDALAEYLADKLAPR